MLKKIKDILKKPYSRILIPQEEGGYSAEILEFPGCFAEGETPNEAFENLEKASEAWIEASLEQELDIPSPAENYNYSGKIVLRMPKSLHKRVAKFSEKEGTSINQFLVTAIAARVGAEEYHSFLCDRYWYGLGNAIQTQLNVETVQFYDQTIYIDSRNLEIKTTSKQKDVFTIPDGFSPIALNEQYGGM